MSADQAGQIGMEAQAYREKLLKRMSPADLQRVGQHDERGAESLGLMLKMFGGHDLAHLAQITRSIQAIQRPG
jgi:hypothetical protein